MRKLLLCPALALVCLLPALASEPGEPLDCSDWVFLEPGYWCEQFVPFPCAPDDIFCTAIDWVGFPTDNESHFLELRLVQHVAPPCSVGDQGLDEVQIVRTDYQRSETIVGYLRERCNGTVRDRSETCTGVFDLHPPCISFDRASGRLLVKTQNWASGPDDWGWQVFAIFGFATLFDVAQSYNPTASTVGFRVPYMPEGFQYADYFDTYYGDLASVGDWSQAQPLQCGYPSTPPDVGDYLTVADTLPTPGPGLGYYYVTAVSYQGERRYGRQCVNGVLSGRDPAVLPGCSQ